MKVFCNNDGVSCYMNSGSIGLAWTGLLLEMTAAEWGDSGFYLKTCVQPTLLPLDVHHSFSFLGSWY